MGDCFEMVFHKPPICSCSSSWIFARLSGTGLQILKYIRSSSLVTRLLLHTHTHGGGQGEREGEGGRERQRQTHTVSFYIQMASINLKTHFRDWSFSSVEYLPGMCETVSLIPI